MTTIDRIFQIIKENNLTAKEFAEATGLSPGNITDWKTRRAKPSTEALIKIANTYNISIDYLLCRSNLKVPIDQYDYFITSNLVEYVFNKYEKKIKCLELNKMQVYNLKKSINNFISNKESDRFLSSEIKRMSHSIKKNKEFEKLYIFLVEKILSMKFITFKKTPIENNENGIASNYYIDLTSEYFELEKKIDLDNKDLKFIEEIMNKVNSLYIDGPIFECNDTHYTNNKKENSLNKNLPLVPIINKIVAGKPILAQEYLEGYLSVDPDIYGLSTSDELFYLKVSGESMNLKVHNGDYVLVHKQDIVEDGDIIVAIINRNDKATLKRYKKINKEIIMLESMSTYPIEPIIINLKETNFKIIGKAIGYFGKF